MLKKNVDKLIYMFDNFQHLLQDNIQYKIKENMQRYFKSI